MNRWAAIARFGGLGDNLMAASVLAPLKRMGYMTEVIAGTPNHVLYLHNPHIDKLSIKVTERDMPKDTNEWQAWLRSRAYEYDVFGHFSHACEGRHAIFKHMTSFWWRAEYRRKLCAGSYLETMHDIMGVPHEFGPLFYSSDEEKANALQVKATVGPRTIAWVLNGSRIDKVYPYAALAVSRIIKEIGASVIIFGGSGEKEISMAQKIKDYVESHNSTRDGLFLALPSRIDVNQSFPVRASISLMNACDLIVSPDTGLAWAAAMEPIPKIILISHASVENITKHWVNTTTLHADPERVPCWPCHRLHDDPSTCIMNKEENGAACISDISVEKLVSTVAEQWRKVNGNVVHAERTFAMARGA